MPPELVGLHVLRELRAGGSEALERWGFRLSLVGMWLIVVAVFLDVWVAFFRGQRDRLDQFPHLVALRLPLLPISNYEAEKTSSTHSSE